jgi:uncharacterized protein (DUF983 family)
VNPAAAALRGQCPRCGERTLFAGWVRFAPQCRACGLDFAAFNVGDGPAAFLILLIGAILTGAAIAVELLFSAPWWVHLVWGPVGAGLTLGGLRLAKALLLAREHATAAGERRFGP